jgi:hypothetical protein
VTTVTMKATAQVEFIVATDVDLKNILWKETDEALNKVIRTDCDTYSAGVAKVSTAADFTIPMGDVLKGKMLYISTDVAIGVKINASTVVIPVEPSGSYRGILFIHGNITAAIIVKPTTGTADVRYCIVGTET